MNYDKTEFATAFAEFRGYSDSTIKLWHDIVTSSVAGQEFHNVLDLGCGTGRYTNLLHDWFEASVIGIDPSAEMLVQSLRKQSRGTSYKLGSAEAIPLYAGSVDMVFMSMVLHHVNDQKSTVDECFRVLRSNGYVCIRAATKEQIINYPFTSFFPSIGSILKETVQTRSEIESLFLDGGFELVSHKIIATPFADNWDDFIEKISSRSVSVLHDLSDEEFGSGLEAIRNAPRNIHEPKLVEPIDYFVFQRNE